MTYYSIVDWLIPKKLTVSYGVVLEITAFNPPEIQGMKIASRPPAIKRIKSAG